MAWGRNNLAWAVEAVDAPWLAARRAQPRVARSAPRQEAKLEPGATRLCLREGCGLPITRQSPRRPFLYCSRGCKRAVERARTKAAAAVTPEPPRKRSAPREAPCQGPGCCRVVVAVGKSRPRAYCTRVCYAAAKAEARRAAKHREAA